MATAKRYAAFAAVLVCLSGCTLKKQETPSLTGPSTLGTSVQMTASPDTLSLDGSSQSLVTVRAFDSNGQPKPNLPMRAETLIDGTRVDFGTLSARNIVTDASGRATLVYTAPMSATNVDTFMTVKIMVTPAESDAANASGRFVDIRLVPVGIVVPPDGLKADFSMTPTTALDHEPVLFDASASTSSANSPITDFDWDFGDGSQGSGRTVSHAFNTAGPFMVTLKVSDAFGRSQSTQKRITIGTGGTDMTAVIDVSPSPVVFNQQTFFNASRSTAGAGHRIVSYGWNFGDGTTGSGVSTSHTFAQPGTYTVILTITDEAGHTKTTTTQVTVSNDLPTAAFSVSPTTPAAGATITFDGSASSATGGRTITAYAWSFSNGTTASGATVLKTFPAGTFTATLTVTDSAGKSNSRTQSFTVTP